MSNDGDFFHRSKAEQMQFIETFLREFLETADKIEATGEIPELTLFDLKK
jgi:hypothetical protein